MASQDLMSSIETRIVIASQTVTATAAGEIIDTQGFESVTFSINAGVFSNVDAGDFLTFTVAESDDSGMSGGANITGDDIKFGDGWDGVINATDEDVLTYLIRVLSNKRYLQLTATETSDTGNLSALLGVTVILGNPLSAPATA